MMKVSLIVALSENQVIGAGGQLPWRLSADLKRFKRLTMNHHIIMGRKTFESMKAPLAGRTNIVITRDPGYQRAGIQVAANLAQAIALAEAQCLVDGRDEIMVAGGAEIYALALPLATRLYVTTVDVELEGDTYFPDIDFAAWRELSRESFPADAANSHAYTIALFERKAADIGVPP